MHKTISILMLLALTATSLISCTGTGLRARGANPIENQLLAEISLERGDYATAVEKYLTVAQQSRDPEFARRATELANDYGYDGYALIAAERWVRLAPEDPLAHAYLGRLYVRQGDIDGAWESLEIALGDPALRLDQDYATLANDLSTSGAARNGLVLYERFAAAYPGNAGILRSLAELAVQTGDLSRAIEAVRQTIGLRPDWDSTRTWLARLLLLDDQRDSAFEQMAFALEMNPGLDLELEFVRLLAAAEEMESAQARLERLTERYPGEPGVPLVQAALYEESGDLDAAEAIYLALLSRGLYRNECLWNLAVIAFEREDYEGAISLFGQISSGERLEAATIASSQAYMELGNADAALDVLADFAEFYPKRAWAMQQPQAQILAAMGRFDEALGKSTDALDFRPWSAELWLYRGGLLEQLERMDEAIDAFRTAYELAPDDPLTMNAYGYTLTIATRDYAQAEQLIQRALDAQPDNPAIMDSMGWVLFKQGEIERARPWLEQAYALMPDPEVAAHLGELLWQAGEPQAAVEIWADALTEFPDNPVLLEARDRLQGPQD